MAGAAIARYAVGAVATPAGGMGMPGLYTATNVEIVATQNAKNAQGAVAEALAAILRTHGIAAVSYTHLGGCGVGGADA